MTTEQMADDAKKYLQEWINRSSGQHKRAIRKQYTNPFTPTPAQLALRESVKTYKIWFHMLDFGDEVGDGFYSIEKMAKAIQPAIQSKTEADVLAEGIRIFNEATHFNCWRKSYTKPVNDAMDVILKRFPLLPTNVAVNAVHEALETA